MSAVVHLITPVVGNTYSTTFESTDGESYVLTCRVASNLYSGITINRDTTKITLEWKQESDKFIKVNNLMATNSHIVENYFLARNATSASILSDHIGQNVGIIVSVIPHAHLTECLPESDSTHFFHHMSATSTKKQPVQEKKLEQLSTDMNHLFESGNLSDIVLTVGSKEIPAHKLILSTRSSVFAKMLQHPMKESLQNRITIKDTSMEVLREVLHFMYSGTVNIQDSKMARDLYVAADKYDVQDLRGICSSILKSVDVENVLETLLLADMYTDNALKEAALHFIFKNYSQLKTQENWSTFMKAHQALAIEILSFVIDKK